MNQGKNMKMKRNEKGITLIALIITVIILVILAAVSIRAVTSMKIVEYAINGSQNYVVAGKTENKTLDDTVKFIENAVGKLDKIQNPLKPGQKTTENTEYISDGKTAIIPAGWTISGNSKETSIDKGLVIYYIDDVTDDEIKDIIWEDADGNTPVDLRKTYDQFVWIPIPKKNINKMFMCQGKTPDTECDIKLDTNGNPYCINHNTNNTKMAGRLYASSTQGNFDASLTTQTYNPNSNLGEPAIVTDADEKSTNLSRILTILGTRTDPNEKYDSSYNFLTILQNEYNAIVRSVYLNEGFWVGRYETSGMINSNLEGTVKVIAGASNTSGENPRISKINWYRMYAQQKKYAENKGMLGGMIQGAAYDQMLIYLQDYNYDVTESGKGKVSHTFSSAYQTGNTAYPVKDKDGLDTARYADIWNNIFDIEGNVYELTTEVYNNCYRIGRGGDYSGNVSASYRYKGNGAETWDDASGSRITLYIK